MELNFSLQDKKDKNNQVKRKEKEGKKERERGRMCGKKDWGRKKILDIGGKGGRKK